MTHRRSFAAPLVTLALGTGLQLGELLALPWGSDGLDVDAGIVRVRRSLDRHRDEHGRYPLVPAHEHHAATCRYRPTTAMSRVACREPRAVATGTRSPPRSPQQATCSPNGGALVGVVAP